MKFLPFLIVAIIIGGLWYFWQTDDDRGPQQVFVAIEKKVAPLAANLSQQYLQQGRLKPQLLQKGQITIQQPTRLSVDYQISVTEQSIMVTLRSSDERLNNRRILFQPKLNESSTSKVVWNCTGGDLLMRYRSKSCRTGGGLKF